MKRLLVILVVLPLLAAKQFGVGSRNFSTATVPTGCTVPATATSHWTASHGLGYGSMVDSIGGNNATQSSVPAQPTYVAAVAAISNNPAVQLNGSSSYLNLTSNITTNGKANTFWQVFEVTAITVGGFQVFFGSSTANQAIVTTVALNSAVQPNLGWSGFANLATGAGTYSTGTWYAWVYSYDDVSGNIAIYNCVAGTCTSIASANNPLPTTPDNTLGYYTSGIANYWAGYMADGGYMSHVDSNPSVDIGAYIHCQYGI